LLFLPPFEIFRLTDRIYAAFPLQAFLVLSTTLTICLPQGSHQGRLPIPPLFPCSSFSMKPRYFSFFDKLFFFTPPFRVSHVLAEGPVPQSAHVKEPLREDHTFMNMLPVQNVISIFTFERFLSRQTHLFVCWSRFFVGMCSPLFPNRRAPPYGEDF